MNPKYFRLLSWAMLCLGSIAVLFFGYYASGGRVLFDRIIAWALLPYLFALVAASLPQARTGAFVVFLACAFLTFVGMWGYYRSIYVHPDAQGALVFIFLPLWQIVGSVVLLVFACAASFVAVFTDTTRAA